MRANAHHHPALRVSDLERAAQFYLDAFDGHWVTRPFVLQGPFAEMVFGGPRGAAYAVCHVGFDEGSCVELFEFLEPVVADPGHPPHPRATCCTSASRWTTSPRRWRASRPRAGAASGPRSRSGATPASST